MKLRGTAPFIGLRVRAIRDMKNMTIEDLADNSGLSSRFISDVERGKTKISTDTLYSLGLGLGLNDPAELLDVATIEIYLPAQNQEE